MPNYLHPGVYVEEIPSGSKPIESVCTSTAAFIGYATKGPIGKPNLITTMGDFDKEYDGIRNLQKQKQGDPMGLSVSAFFQNGGSNAYIVRITADWLKNNSEALLAEKAVGYLDNPSDSNNKALKFTAVNEGVWANNIIVKMSISQSNSNLYDMEIGRNNDAHEFSPIESFMGVSLDTNEPLYIKKVINEVSKLVSVDLAENGAAALLEGTLSGGTDGGEPGEDDYVEVFTRFIKYRDINIICLPGQHWSTDGSGNQIILKAIAHAEQMKDRMVIIDPPPTHELDNLQKVEDMGLPNQTYCVIYYPWVETTNKFYHAEHHPELPKNVLVPPSGYAAGMWAKIGGKRGVWKAPAGTEAGLLGAAKLEYIIENGEQDILNPLGVNCFRNIPGAGKVIWGARTLATKADPEWRYVPVRRTAIMIERSIYNGIQWAVFEPNDHRLWSALRANIGGFLNGLFRVGAFQGEKASDAYYVRCGLGDTMTQADIDTGQVIVVVGFAPLKPAEFVIVRIQQKVNQQ